jgi:zinc transporter ZupT
MTLLRIAYLALLAYIGWRSVESSVRKHGWPAITLEVITSIGWPLLVAAFFWPGFANSVHTIAPPLFAVAAIWTLYTVWRDFRPEAAREHFPPTMTPTQRTAAYAVSWTLCATIVVPVFVLGAIVVARALNAAV